MNKFVSYSDWIHAQFLDVLNGTPNPCHYCESGCCDICNRME